MGATADTLSIAFCPWWAIALFYRRRMVPSVVEAATMALRWLDRAGNGARNDAMKGRAHAHNAMITCQQGRWQHQVSAHLMGMYEVL